MTTIEILQGIKGWITTKLSKVVSVTAQTFTDAEKKQARTNLGFGNGDIDDEPAAESDNLVKSGGVYSSTVNSLSINSNGFALPIKTYFSFRISKDGNWVEASSGAMGLYHVNRGEIIEIVAQADKECYVGLLSDIDNVADGNPAHFMDGTSSVIVVPMGTTKSICALTEGYFFFNRLTLDGKSLRLPQSLKKLIPIKRNVLLENLSDKTIIEGEATTSNTSTTMNMISVTDIFIPANTEFNIQMTGIGIYSSKWGMQINGGGTLYYTESLQAFSFPYNVTSIRILTKKADFISEGVVSARVYIKDLGTIIPEMQRAIQRGGLSVLQSISLDTLKEAAGIQTNEFTEDFSIIISSNELNKSNCIISCVAKYIQASGVTDVPTVQIYDSNLASNYRQRYIAGGKDTFECKQWRYPMLIGSNNTITVVFTIPSGVTLTVNSFSVTQSNETSRETMKLYEHNGYWGATFNARLAFQQAAICGYYGAIVVPKMTVDGIFVCYHDDGTLSANNDLQMVGGEPLTQELGALKMTELTFAQTQMLEYKSANIIGEHSRIPTLEEFFKCCAKTGVHPCLSCHPALDTDKFGAVKALADKYHITDKLTIKQNSAYATTVFNVFGNSIEAYLPDIPAVTDDLTSIISNLDAANFDKTKVVVGVEFMNTTKALEALNRAVGGVSDLVSAGYMWGVFENTPDIGAMKQLNEAGCYEWTIGAFFCNGLNW